MLAAHEVLSELARRQDNVVLVRQALALGATKAQLQALVDYGGWRRLMRGVLVAPAPPDPFRASARAVALTSPDGALAGPTAARLLGLDGLPMWTSDERPWVLLPSEVKRRQRQGVVTRWGLRHEETQWCSGFRITRPVRTLLDLTEAVPQPVLVCLLDTALRQGLLDPRDISAAQARPSLGRRVARLVAALALADGRAESPLETHARLVLVHGGLPPETLQYEIRNAAGVLLARTDIAWPSRRLAIETDGSVHDAPAALYRDRERQNELVLAGWTVLRFTWSDVLNRPDELLHRVRRALYSSARNAG